MSLKVSIIIPIYNVSEFIERCACSVFNQTYENIECIFVDDCTPDNSMDILYDVINQFPSRKNQIKIIRHDKNKGLSSARNTGINNSVGDYLYFLDSDDKISDNAIESLVGLAMQYRSDFVIGGVEIQGDYPEVTLPFKDGATITNNAEILSSFLKREWYVMAWNKLIARDFLIKSQLYFYEGIYHEDLLWSFNLALEAQSMAVYLGKTYTYYIRGNSISTVVKSKNVKDLVFIYNTLIETVRDEKDLALNSDLINFLESTRFYILTMCKDKAFWIDMKNRMISITKISMKSLLIDKHSMETKLKWVLLLLPSNISFFLFSVWKKILKK